MNLPHLATCLVPVQDQYFGPEESVAKIVADNGGYGDNLTGNGFKTMVRQGVKTGLVCRLESLAAAPHTFWRVWSTETC